MTKTTLLAVLLCLLSAGAAAAQKIEPPKLTPTPLTDSQKALVKEGTALHDRGDYEGAIAKYEQVLAENPNNDLVLYELSFTYQMKKDYRKSLELAMKGVQYKSEELSLFYVVIGNDLDELGESKKAVEVYKQGIKLEPANAMLYYNLALTHARLNDLEEAKKNLKKAVYLNPNHPSSHVALAQVFQKTGYKTPALFAVMRFLVVEPRTRRSATAYRLFSELMQGGVSAGKNPNEINIFFDPNTKKDEGDFGSLELVLGLSKAASATEKEKEKNKSAAQQLVAQIDTFLAILSEGDPKGDKGKFVWRYYIPYFIELKKRNYVEPFAYYISQASGLSGVPEWLQANEARVNEFVSWSQGYQWPRE
jgi:tetratricopeptide (TPR) repeat protein